MSLRRPARHSPLVRLTAAAVSISVVALPALVAGRHIDAPAAPGELALLQAVLAPNGDAVVRSEVVRAWFSAWLPDVAWPADAAAQQPLVAAARGAQLAGLGALAAVLYFSLLLARGRLQALLACVFFALSPAVLGDGVRVRPEVPFALLSAFAILLLQCVAVAPRDGRQLADAAHGLRQAGCALCALVANGLAVAALPVHGDGLLLPGVVLTLAALQAAVRGYRTLQRRTFLRVPLRAINRRLLPWTAMALLGPAVAWWLLSRSVAVPSELLVATPSAHGLLPTDWLPRALLAVLFALGGVVAVLRVGVRFGRRGRLGPDLVLFVAAALQLAVAAVGPSGIDALPAGLAAAVLAGEGARALLVLLRGRRVSR